MVIILSDVLMIMITLSSSQWVTTVLIHRNCIFLKKYDRYKINDFKLNLEILTLQNIFETVLNL